MLTNSLDREMRMVREVVEVMRRALEVLEELHYTLLTNSLDRCRNRNPSYSGTKPTHTTHNLESCITLC